MEHLSHARHALRKLSRHAGGPQPAHRALHRGHPRLAAQRCGRQGRGEGDRYRQAHLRLQPARRYSDDRARAGGAGDRAGRPLHRHLCGVQRAAVQGGDARSAHHRGRELLRRRHAGEPPPRARDDEDVPDQGRQRQKKKGKRPACGTLPFFSSPCACRGRKRWSARACTPSRRRGSHPRSPQTAPAPARRPRK